jgi:alpha-1,2-mannosyltransferase
MGRSVDLCVMANRFRVAAAAGAANVAAATFFLLRFSRHGVGFGFYHMDLDVYRIGSQVWLHGGNLYGTIPRTSTGRELPFTYPPLAAALLSPLAVVPMVVAGTVLSVLSIALTGVVLRVFARSLSLTWGSRFGFWWLLPLAVFLEPVRSTLGFGQIDVVLMALVSLDCLLPSLRGKRGILTGVAAAVKLTPAAFILFFLLRGDRRAAATSALSFGAFTAAGFALDWHGSVRYWTTDVFDTSRVGSPSFASNQSLQGVFARAGLAPGTSGGTAVWLALSAAVTIVAVIGMRRALALGVPSWALTLNAFAALLISPVSWTHHWVWAVPGLLVLAVLARRRSWRAGIAACCGGFVIFMLSPPWLLPHDGNAALHWAPWQQVAGDSYAIIAVIVLVLSARLPLVSRPTAPVQAEMQRLLVGLRDLPDRPPVS